MRTLWYSNQYLTFRRHMPLLIHPRAFPDPALLLNSLDGNEACLKNEVYAM